MNDCVISLTAVMPTCVKFCDRTALGSVHTHVCAMQVIWSWGQSFDLSRRSFLRTLDQRNLSNGAAEMLKMACIKDAPLFEVLERHGSELIARHFQSPAASVAMRRSIQGMVSCSFTVCRLGKPAVTAAMLRMRWADLHHVSSACGRDCAALLCALPEAVLQ